MGCSVRQRNRVRIGVTALATLAVVGSGTAIVTTPEAAASFEPGEWNETAYRGQVEVVPAKDGQPDHRVLKGRVFVDRDRDSVSDPGERGLRGVTVSNGRDVVTTDARGRYELPVYDNMTVFITQPSGYQVPVDEHNVAQFHYNHLPEGSPDLRYGGIAPTGPVPAAVNFPVVRKIGRASCRERV